MMDEVGHGWGMGWWWIFGFLIFILAIWLILKAVNQSSRTTNSDKTPLDILNDRYARGEIDKQEYEQRKNDLNTP